MTDPAETLMAAATTYKQNDEHYGAFDATHATAADIASTLLGTVLTPHQVALVMMAVKLARIASNPGHLDSYKDLINYSAFASALAPAAGVKGQDEKPADPAQPTAQEAYAKLAALRAPSGPTS